MRDKHIFRVVMVPAAVLAGGFWAAALEYVPVYNVAVMGGQYFMQKSRGNVSANMNAVAAPVLRSASRWTFMPMYVGDYAGTKGVDDGVGAGTLYQERMDHKLAFAAHYAPPATTWKLKPSASYKREFLKETRDETWGKGLFDYEKIAVGFEAENTYQEPFSYRLGMDIYRIRFPNFSSLESSVGADPQGNPLGRELSSKNVLDTMNYQLAASVSRPFPYDEPVVSLNAGYSFTFQDYDDQRLVDARGQMLNQGRRDYLQSLSLGATYPRAVRWFGREERAAVNLSAGLAYNGSNQNTYDASRTKFVPDSYSYYNISLGPSATLAWGDKNRPAWVSAGLRYNHLRYLGRLVQDGDGVYGDGNQWQDRYILGLAYAYPIAKGFYLKVQSNMLWARSNQNYEKTYAYNYRTANYMMGFTYEY